jgi:anti-sigma factor RsiW
MTTEHWSDRLSAYLDGELAEADHERADIHLRSCDACRAELDAIRSIQRRVRRPPETTPANDPWPDIARAIARPGMTLTTTLRLAATILVAVSIGGAYWFLGDAIGPAGSGAEAPAGAVDTAQAFRTEVEALEQRFAELEGQLDARTVAAVRESMVTLNAALAAAESELARDQRNALLDALVNRVRNQKLRLLRAVITPQRST